ncbi:MAG: UvrD-helicase domain-containing protein [Hydrogenophilus sp.]|nr:UvrD-helicase domain-containing protein [Hydrogenophilus sp.]
MNSAYKKPGGAALGQIPEELHTLDPAQQNAVTRPAEHVLVLAGAGSGKTRVLTHRVAWLIACEGVDPEAILAVTFTNKAAREMRDRLSLLLAPAAVNSRWGVWLGTFHAVAHRLLRQHAAEAGLIPSFQILDSQDQLALIKRLLRRYNIDEGEVAPRELMAFINSHKDKGERVDRFEPIGARQAQLAELWRAYEAQCAQEGVVDFSELLLRVLELLETNPDLRLRYRSRFAHLLVDEFQDTNPLQYRLLKQLALDPESGESGAWLFCVGDDDQSIYSFRGALPAVLAYFQREFRATLVRLERNYRSAGNILAAANSIIAHNRDRIGKALWTERGEGEPIRVFMADDEMGEARFVASSISALIEEGIPAKEIAILYRTNALSRAFEHQLLALGIPYRVYGGLRFFERAEVKHALAYLRLLLFPEDEGALLRVINVPARGIGSKTIEALLKAREPGESWESVAMRLGGRGGVAVRQFAEQIRTMRAETASLPLPDAIAWVIEKSGLAASYAQGEEEGGQKEREERLENLEALVAAGHDFVAEMAREGISLAGHEMISLFLQHAALESGEHQGIEEHRAVRLMTVHAAKGLEFDTVFLVGLEEGLFPHENALESAFRTVTPDAIEEERRLMYVGVTRAKRQLFLTWAASRRLHGGVRYHAPSRFIQEIPEELLRWLSPRPTQRGKEFSRGAPMAAAEGAIASSPLYLWRPGMRVRHSKFGEGVIVRVAGAGAQTEATVRFAPPVGEKRLLVALAKMTPLSDG